MDGSRAELWPLVTAETAVRVVCGTAGAVVAGVTEPAVVLVCDGTPVVADPVAASTPPPAIVPGIGSTVLDCADAPVRLDEAVVAESTLDVTGVAVLASGAPAVVAVDAPAVAPDPLPRAIPPADWAVVGSSPRFGKTVARVVD